MKKPTFESWVTGFVANLSSHFNLPGWTIRIVFVRKTKGDTVAEMDINSVYNHAIMSVYPEARRYFKTKNFDMLTQAIVHEMVHVFLDPFLRQMSPHLSETTHPNFMNILEQQTQKLTMVLLKTLPKNLIPPR